MKGGFLKATSTCAYVCLLGIQNSVNGDATNRRKEAKTKADDLLSKVDNGVFTRDELILIADNLRKYQPSVFDEESQKMQ